MKAGAVDFLPKPFSDDQMLAAVNAALDADRTRRIETAGTEQLRRCYERLTPREREVMGFVVTGLMNESLRAWSDEAPRSIGISATER